MTLQTSLVSYYSMRQDEIEAGLLEVNKNKEDPMRLQNIMNTELKDSDFRQFPFPHTAYRIDNNYLSHDLFAEFPLPHHLGSFLYTSKDRTKQQTFASKKN